MSLTAFQFLIAQDDMRLITGWQYKAKEDQDWKDCQLPSSIYSILESQGLIPNPYLPGQEGILQWVDQKTWMFRAFFQPDSSWKNNKKTELLLSGLDVFAEVRLNGTTVVKTENAFRSWTIPIDPWLKSDSNELLIIFQPTFPECIQRFKKLPAPLPGEERVVARTAQFRFGWDFAPRFTGCAIRQLPAIRHTRNIALENFRIHTLQIQEDQAELELILNLRTEYSDTCFIQLIIGQDSFYFSGQSGNLMKEQRMRLTLRNPKLWWPSGQGSQHLYNCHLNIYNSDGVPLVSRTRTLGIRTIRLIQEPDEYGSSFQFIVNDRPVFMKGANLVPDDALSPLHTDPEVFIRSLQESHFNMIRIWGGGTYESDSFYQACDQYGILVWQDFMFACAMYPGDDHFLENVREEALQQITRLSGYACIALWCGNNENHEGWERWGWQLTLTPKSRKRIWGDYEKLFLDILPGLVSSYGNQCSYVDSSPKFGRGDSRFKKEGDAHDWGIWHDGLPFSEFAKRVPRFLSEAGFQSLPSVEILSRYIPDQDLQIDSDAMKTRQKHRIGFNIMSDYISRDLPEPKDVPSWSYLSQINQAEGMALGIKAHRLAKPYCMGTLYWQLNDCWPGISWSGIEYGGRWKAMHHKAYHLYQPVLCTAQIKEKQLELSVVSDLPHADSIQVKLRILDSEGREFYSWATQALISADLPVRLLAMDISEIMELTKISKIFVLTEWAYGSQSDYELVPLVPLKEVAFKKANFTIQDFKQTPNGFEFLLSTDQIAKSVYLGETSDWRFYPNFIDLIPGRPMVVKLFTSSQQLTPDELKIQSIFDFQNQNK